jgi:Ni/Co efflux regulator RcnB
MLAIALPGAKSHHREFVMKALLTAFALLSFVAASTLPMAARAEDQADHSMNTDDHSMNKTDKMSGKTMHSTAKHKVHKKSVHKKVKHHKSAAKHHKTDKTPPKEG